MEYFARFYRTGSSWNWEVERKDPDRPDHRSYVGDGSSSTESEARTAAAVCAEKSQHYWNQYRVRSETQWEPLSI